LGPSRSHSAGLYRKDEKRIKELGWLPDINQTYDKILTFSVKNG